MITTMDADNVIPFPTKFIERTIDGGEVAGPVKTLIISDGVYSMPGAAFPFPAAAAVDPKYLAALEKQKGQRENG
jgi:hypothetical protein